MMSNAWKKVFGGVKATLVSDVATQVGFVQRQTVRFTPRTRQTPPPPHPVGWQTSWLSGLELSAPLVTKQITDTTEAKCVTLGPRSRRIETLSAVLKMTLSVSAWKEDWLAGFIDVNDWKKTCCCNVSSQFNVKISIWKRSLWLTHLGGGELLKEIHQDFC